MTQRICTVAHCKRPHMARGWCAMHAERWRRYGDPTLLVGKGRPPQEVRARFFSKIDEVNGCWLWTGKIDPGGYGQFWMPTKTWRAHRFAYTEFVMPIPAGMTIDHICHTNSDCAGGPGCEHRRCVNPAHLEAVSDVENLQRRVRRWVGISPAALTTRP